jgi:zinc D-Ala-D-Ala carboxypeptidase
MSQLSKYTTLQEVIKSNQASVLQIPNIPNSEQVANLKLVCTEVFDKVREHFGKPIGISSGFRSVELNQRIGGSKSSQHMEGKALDIDGDLYGGVSNKAIFDYIKNNCTFDQLIWEFGTANAPDWVHVSYNKGVNRKQILRAIKSGGKTIYRPF